LLPHSWLALVAPSASDSSRLEITTLLLTVMTTISRDPLLVRVRKTMSRDSLRMEERELKNFHLLVVLDRIRKMMKIDLLKDLHKNVLLVPFLRIRKMMKSLIS
jgi:hypothetical protein